MKREEKEIGEEREGGRTILSPLFFFSLFFYILFSLKNTFLRILISKNSQKNSKKIHKMPIKNLHILDESLSLKYP